MKVISGYRLPFVLLAGILALLHASCTTAEYKKPAFIIVRSASDIIPIENLEQVPLVLYDNQINFNGFTVEQKKSLFIQLLLPSVLVATEVQYHLFNRLNRTMHTYHGAGYIDPLDSVWMDSLQQEYHARNYWDLRRRLKPNPPSIVLAQAAVESGWGTSRFFIEANNVFGVWSFDERGDRIKTMGNRNWGSVYLRKYATIYASVRDHLRLYSTVAAYEKFRTIRIKEPDPLALIPYLGKYSEQGPVYVEKIRSVIVQNNLEVYDSAKVDPSYSRELLNEL